ncbi:MAG: heme biosynthesis HemY N-terminal domain-containing protein [Pseudomonadota bacterium]
MSRFIFKLLLVVIIALGAVLLVRDDPGFVLLRYRDYSIETTLAFALVALIILVLALQYLIRLLRGLWRLPGSVQSQSRRRRLDKARRQLTQGLIDLAEGRFEQAENHLVRLVDFSDSPILHYLAAARAAQLQGKYDARDRYLMAAHEANPDAEIAVGVTQAELQLAHMQTEQALATLSHLHSIAPKHDYVLMLLAKAYYRLEDWSSLVEILPDVRRKKLIKTSELKSMDQAAYRGVLQQSTGSQQAFEQAWAKVPKSTQTDADMMHFYIRLMNKNGWSSKSVEQLLVKSLESQWDDGLIEVYGNFEAADANAQLARAEKWLKEFDHKAHLLLALGRIAMRARLWGKAQGYLEASIGAEATPAACLSLAELFEQHLQQPDKAAVYFKQGLKLSLQDGD